ncbi:MAG: hypothetical protein ABIB47_01555 [Candidatus Woesearchaeota archaeon]
MNKLKWCCRQKKGIILIEPNENLSKEYIQSSEENLSAMGTLKGKWKSITSYYACYDCIYALLQKVGIKCEIHDCTIELLDLFEIDKKWINFIKDLKKERIHVQYYLKKPKEVDDVRIKDFVNDCKLVINTISEDEVNIIRRKIKSVV